MTELRRSYDMLLMKVLSLVQDSDQNLRGVSTVSLDHCFHYVRACRDLLFLLSGVSTHLEHSPARVCGRITCGEEGARIDRRDVDRSERWPTTGLARAGGSEQTLQPLPQVLQQRSFTRRTALIRRAASLSLTCGSRRGVHGDWRA
jgi:hypothetical protein